MVAALFTAAFNPVPAVKLRSVEPAEAEADRKRSRAETEFARAEPHHAAGNRLDFRRAPVDIREVDSRRRLDDELKLRCPVQLRFKRDSAVGITDGG